MAMGKAFWAIALAATCGVAAADDSISTQTLVNIITVALVLGTWFFWWTSITAERSYFLLLGTFCCALGNAVFGVMIIEEQGNVTWGTLFLCLVLPALHGLYAQFLRYRREGVFSDSDEEEGEDGSGVPPPALAPPTEGGRPLPKLLAEQAAVKARAEQLKKRR
ncbi:unnamed protein product [Symbiodinium sp. KB8]|nr:unnamed protein product [Symbiodinium sp. KB8]